MTIWVAQHVPQEGVLVGDACDRFAPEIGAGVAGVAFDAEQGLGRTNHWAYDRNRLATLRQAEAALVRLIA
jgi:hypothetical protein